MPLVLEPSWMGRRVSVRRVTPGGPARTSDVVGDLVALDASTAVIQGRHGAVEVALGAITHAKPVPASTREELALEAVAARGPRPDRTHDIGGWQLRADHGFTSRANSVLPLAPPGLPLDDALAAAHEWYAARGLPVRIQVPVEARRLLDAALGERGWDVDKPTAVYVRRLDATTPPTPPAPPVTLGPRPSDGWLELYRAGTGATPTGRALLTRHDRVAFAEVRIGERVVAVGRGAVDDGWLGVMAVEVEPNHRRKGLARAVMAALGRWGRDQGAVRTYLQVAADNVPALALYEALGYWHHHADHYRVEPGP
jgi:GNAT superfamily N-acetyltransferase